MTKSKPRYFRIVFIDHDECTMNVSEIMTDDTAVTARTAGLQESGRNVNTSATSTHTAIDQVPSVESQCLPGFEKDPNLHW